MNNKIFCHSCERVVDVATYSNNVMGKEHQKKERALLTLFGIPPPVREEVFIDIDQHDLSDHPVQQPSTAHRAASRFKDTSAPRPNPPNQSLTIGLTVPQHTVPQRPIPQYPLPQPNFLRCLPTVPTTLPSAACKRWEAFRLAAPVSAPSRPTPRP